MRRAFVAVAALSGVSNILMLTGPLFMLQVYDRVLASQNVPTLVALSGLVVFLYLFLGSVDALRARMLIRIGWRVDEKIGPDALMQTFDLGLRNARANNQPLHDLDQIRQFLGGAGPVAICDLPWMPVFLAIVFVFHPWLGVLALVGGALLVVLTLISEVVTRKKVATMNSQTVQRDRLVEAGRRNAEALRAMGMEKAFSQSWAKLNNRYLRDNTAVGDVNSTFSAYIKVIRLALQSGVLALGAYLAIHQEVTPGTMIAASILTARALSPVEQAIGNWRGFVAARQARRRLDEMLVTQGQSEDTRTRLPAPSRNLTVSNLVVGTQDGNAPGQSKVLLRINALTLSAGDGLGVIGPSGSGKSTLGRALVGIGKMRGGKIRLDGAELSHWDRDELGKHIGYLPQDVELFDDTVARNIARLQNGASSSDIVQAAKSAGVHDMILSLPNGYDTRIGVGGVVLSGGQRQRIGLARALFGDPFLIVLDEPNASLDSDGEQALLQSVQSARARGAIVVLIAHRPSALATVNLATVIQGGHQIAFGKRDDILRRTVRQVGESA
ncbi:type I secretion system permease/ATPase [Thalassospira povalilytica]|uniref:type I secretion system permease/ATPase n=1 Tax=Thalassospira povalilytica TaxID=732237 RepID=UPI00224BFFC3|nr:type I secretion system permease/ATPase [Thalassospira povalilytica]